MYETGDFMQILAELLPYIQSGFVCLDEWITFPLLRGNRRDISSALTPWFSEFPQKSIKLQKFTWISIELFKKENQKLIITKGSLTWRSDEQFYSEILTGCTEMLC